MGSLCRYASKLPIKTETQSCQPASGCVRLQLSMICMKRLFTSTYSIATGASLHILVRDIYHNT